MRTRGAIIALSLALVGVSGCSSSKTSPPAARATSSTVHVKDFSIALAPAALAAGSVTFNVTNNGPSVHEFVIFRTDLAADKLPLNKDGEVDESGAGVTHIDEKEDIAVGASTALTITATAGNYVAVCNLPGHYKQGMRTSFTVA